MGRIRSYRDLIAWQKAMDLCKRIYAATTGFPKEEAYGLVQQMRRAAVSVPSNIAEGWGRALRKDYCRYLRMARGSLFELETQTMLARDLRFLAGEYADDVLSHADECSRVLQGLIGSLQGDKNADA